MMGYDSPLEQWRRMAATESALMRRRDFGPAGKQIGAGTRQVALVRVLRPEWKPASQIAKASGVDGKQIASCLRGLSEIGVVEIEKINLTSQMYRRGPEWENWMAEHGSEE